jgi:hypothetical protein
MDAQWFKDIQRRAGVTSSDLGRRLGRDRTIVARIYAGRQVMTLAQAEVFAELLHVSLEDVLHHAGLRSARSAPPGMAEGDAVPFARGDQPPPMLDRITEAARSDRPGVDIWQVRSSAMRLAGYLPGDWLLVDTHAASHVASGDTVIAQVYDLATGSAKTLLREFQKPALVAHSADTGDWPVHIVNDQSVLVRGVIIASWRVLSHAAAAPPRAPHATPA